MKGDVRPSATGAGSEATVAVERMGLAGEGVGRWPDGRTAFVAGALPGEVVQARMVASHASYVKSVAVGWLTTSPLRRAPRCPVYPACGGCALQHWDYAAELAYKQDRVREALRRIGQLEDPPLKPILGATEVFHYRNKGQFPWAVRDGRPVLGLYQRDSHAVVPTDFCAIQDPAINRVLPVARDAAERLGIPVYEESSSRGVLRHLVVRSSRLEGKTLVLAVAARWDARLLQWAKVVFQEAEGVAGVGWNHQPDPGNRVLGHRTAVLVGRDHLEEEILGLRFSVSFTAFFQVHPQQVERLYATALEAAGPWLTRGEAWDLYAGVGTLAALLAQKAPQVRAVEINPAAVADARTNFARNRLRNIRIEAAPADQAVRRWAAEGPPPAVVVVDPPRRGLDPEVTRHLLATRPPAVVYVSCRPETLARDLAQLTEAYTVQWVQPVDMFPRTDHVEAVAALRAR
ncbi:MAG: 23S rRNA (uracil(1939)-C(5))-methyltransferase RlmD [Firmicutes bacterium]|nr:23S rRNA (uracil(1939)-C(5))-methyltransferase RlmD [Alicyclobacillaceae bacterium]MCL6497898.1 23S rRNA (uracil(1939)-C(5))-methyltransferase RlmD [Bacillota bacterium]